MRFLITRIVHECVVISLLLSVYFNGHDFPCHYFIIRFMEWDNQFFGIGDIEAKQIDPQQHFVLECTPYGYGRWRYHEKIRRWHKHWRLYRYLFSLLHLPRFNTRTYIRVIMHFLVITPLHSHYVALLSFLYLPLTFWSKFECDLFKA